MNLVIRRFRTTLSINRWFRFVIQTVINIVTDMVNSKQILGKEVDRLKEYTTMKIEQVINCTNKCETFENRVDQIERNIRFSCFKISN